MRAGKLDREITIEARSDTGADSYGTPTEGWALFAALRAQILQSATEEFFRASGEGADTAIVFRTRFVAGVTNKHRIAYAGRYFDIEEVKEIGRGKALELRGKAAE